ncbi:MAG TPA: biotin--[acetyl-CoA-carboxylase] ligase [Tepidisphaeraceae bacterium]|nr:biotin--[acetyl-CoA-carboxylase] ligase [Tepidisphaeraceae bacterium]
MQRSFDLARLRAGLRPFHLHWFPRLRSTNDHAAFMRRHGRLFAPSIVLTGRQTAGRGRGVNQWFSNEHVLTVTFVIAADEQLAAHELPLIAGLAVRDAAAELTGKSDVELKWPNDVLFAGRKLAGLLCERVNKADLIGVGLNVDLDPSDAPPALRKTITSLAAIGGNPVGRTDALLVIASHLHLALRRRDRQPFAVFLRDYQQHHALLGRRVTIHADDSVITGRVEGIDAKARLLVRERGTLHRIVAGQVHLA